MASGAGRFWQAYCGCPRALSCLFMKTASYTSLLTITQPFFFFLSSFISSFSSSKWNKLTYFPSLVFSLNSLYPTLSTSCSLTPSLLCLSPVLTPSAEITILKWEKKESSLAHANAARLYFKRRALVIKRPTNKTKPLRNKRAKRSREVQRPPSSHPSLIPLSALSCLVWLRSPCMPSLLGEFHRLVESCNGKTSKKINKKKSEHDCQTVPILLRQHLFFITPYPLRSRHRLTWMFVPCFDPMCSEKDGVNLSAAAI